MFIQLRSHNGWRSRLAATFGILFGLAFNAFAQEAPPPDPGAGKTATVQFYNRDIVELRTNFLGHTPELRARAAEANIRRVADRWGTPKANFKSTTEGEIILLDGTLITILTPGDADSLHGQTLQTLRSQTTARLTEAVAAAKRDRAPQHFLWSVLWSFGAAVLASVLVVYILSFGNKARAFLKRRIAGRTSTSKRESVQYLLIVLRAVSDGALRIATGLTIILVLEECVRFILGRFSFTSPWADAMGSWIFHTLATWGHAVASAIPGLVTAAFVLLLARFVARTVSMLFNGVQNERFQLFGIDRQLAEPTRKLVVVVIWLFAIAMAYPYLPGAQTDAFKGLSVLVGVMVSLGASGIVGQAAGGFTILYSRTMSVGDFVRCGDVEGTVLQIGVFTTRIRTVTGVEVSIPNNVVLAGQLHNYSRHPDGPGMWMETGVTIGYDSPWRQVHRLLLAASAKTPDVQKDPAPYVLQTALSDFYTEYRLRVRIPEALERARILSELHANIQDEFNAAGVQIMSPNYEADPEQPKLVPREHWEGISDPTDAGATPAQRA
ncbi:mechanosensitive ion channel family protein [Stenotrophomonas sp. SY1]|uniref:mechanosensitive ion channel family protein n=1 Tax=Stenotrophomonas sp. SY1 TaxID=477235 RepID=UPI001E5FCEFB|nr:mechanosensitive ion channel family protein [Stenotrophomonas sp. SY1]